ncbi:glycoside hydrolase family 3 protein [Shewanella woodyi]|uniref:glycoside hydrolase family 3 protein n=1 Tax=Shewanella woodyi TaxID=60961 RepID=UPI0007F87D2C|nr:exo 1,3/1,4-beta-D-glucan glucohydrolase [Shewanella woodyi]
MSVLAYKRSLLSITILAITMTSGCSKEVAPQKEDLEPKEGLQSYAFGGKAVDINIWPALEIPHRNSSEVEGKVAEILAGMTLEQKVAQMIQPEIRDISVEDMRQYGFGSYLNGGGAYPNNDKHALPSDWIALAESMYQASVDASLDGSSIPTMWGTDAVHGHNNVIGATLFPHNIGLGAANNPELIREVAAITAKEVMVTGIDWVFAPTVAVVRDDRWGRTYEGYSEDPEIVLAYSAAIVEGLQGEASGDQFLSSEHVISTVKHFLGDGGTEKGVDQGDNLIDEQGLFDLHGQGYVGGLVAGSQSVMASFNSWHGVKNHGNEYLLTDVLKTRMGFDGFVVGDWNGHGQVLGCTNETCPQAVNAGLDMFMVPTDAWKPLYENTIAEVRSGQISQARIDDAVSRILRVKVRAGLFNKPSPANRPLSGKLELIGHESHRQVAKQAVRESLVMLKNGHNILPLSPKMKVLVAGDGANNIGKQSGGWSITWQGTDNQNSDFPGASSIYDGIKETVLKAGGSATLDIAGQYSEENRPDVAIVVFGEEPYAEGNGDIDNLEYQRGDKRDLALLKRLKSEGIPVVSIFITGRPLWVNPELNASDAFVVAWLPGSEGDAVADVLFSSSDGQVVNDMTGKLSFSWPSTPMQAVVNRFDKDYQPLFKYGHGLSYADKGDSALVSEIKPVDSDILRPLVILKNAVKAPWRLSIGTSADQDLINTSLQTSGPVVMRTIDRVVQEDARKFNLDGKEQGVIRFGANFTRDLRAYEQGNTAVSFDIKLDEFTPQSTQLSMVCDKACGVPVELEEKFKQIAGTGWQTISVDIACFELSSDQLSKVQSPFLFSSKAKITMSLSNIYWLPDYQGQPDVSCH